MICCSRHENTSFKSYPKQIGWKIKILEHFFEIFTIFGQNCKYAKLTFFERKGVWIWFLDMLFAAWNCIKWDLFEANRLKNEQMGPISRFRLGQAGTSWAIMSNGSTQLFQNQESCEEILLTQCCPHRMWLITTYLKRFGAQMSILGLVPILQGSTQGGPKGVSPPFYQYLWNAASVLIVVGLVRKLLSRRF